MFILPIGDDNFGEKTPYVNYGLILINCFLFVLVNIMSGTETLVSYAFIPGNPSFVTVLSSMFLHIGFMHLLGNMLFLFVFIGNKVLGF